MTTQNHSYHLVEKSPWPLLASLNTLFLTMGLVKWFNTTHLLTAVVSLLSLTLTSYLWWRDVSREGSLQGHHTNLVTRGLKMGMALFITSEIMFFFSFFWAFFHMSLAPTMTLGLSWPPTAILPFNPMEIPLLNTLILLSSGVTVTYAHHSMLEGLHLPSVIFLLATIILAIYFTALQKMEYQEAPFTIADSAFGATFFIATGFHGLHVIVGTLFLIIATLRLWVGLLSSNHHFGTEAAIWYWHFVDVVWLFLYSWVYYWTYLK